MELVAGVAPCGFKVRVSVPPLDSFHLANPIGYVNSIEADPFMPNSLGNSCFQSIHGRNTCISFPAAASLLP